jgi:hypothetical protein
MSLARRKEAYDGNLEGVLLEDMLAESSQPARDGFDTELSLTMD